MRINEKLGRDLTLRTYVITRFLLTIPMLFLLVTVVFIVLRVIPGNPIRAMYGELVTPEFLEEMTKKLGLDKPIHLQYVDYWARLIKGDFGVSIWSSRPVIEELSYAFPVTLEVSIAAMILSIVAGMPLGVISALKRDRFHDYLIRFFSLAGFALPIFFLGMILQFVLGLQYPLFPIQGRYGTRLELPYITGFATIDTLITGNFSGFLDVLAHLFLPALGMAWHISALISRISRANMIETLGEDYILTARAKGVRERAVIYKHAFRNAILPVFTVIGIYFALLLGGAVLTESIFSLPGMGLLLIDSIFRRDYPVIQGCIVVYAIAVVVVTTIVDIVYAFLDPRIRY